MKLPVRLVAEWIDAEWIDAERLDPAAESTAAVTGPTVTGWSVDSRSLQTGDLFFALRGPNHDGHAYVGDVLQAGAAAVVVDREIPRSPPAEGRVLRVEDSLQALQQLAARARQLWGGRLVAVTGSAGKTTTKDIIAAMLAEQYRTAKNEGNLNNHVGMPLSLLRLEETAEVAVIEMGMNHAGEIRRLAEIAHPDTAVVTNVGPAHIENFESVDAIAAAKRELIDALSPAGTAVLNADDPRVAAFRSAHPGHSVLYGMSPDADVRAEDVRLLPEGVEFRVNGVRFASFLPGRHAVSNLLAGIAVAEVYGIAAERLPAAVRRLTPGRMRGESLHHHGILIYNDCYNSNPDAVRAMLDVLREAPAQKRIAVLGEMLELGRWAEPLHRDVGSYAARSGLNVLVGIRGAACYMLDAATRSGLRADAAFFFEDPREAGRLVRSLASPGDAVLFKGSRAVRVELALEEFLAQDPAPSPGGSR
jgi:UDP-N-acetylmuramoyl-tripeptide--D-alanyl-D-alanine ligase